MAKVKKEPPKSPRRCLLPNKPAKPITDVYLCENCDAEFTTQAAISAHERQCYGRPEPAPSEPQPTPADLLGYLQLGNLTFSPFTTTSVTAFYLVYYMSCLDSGQFL